MAALLVIFAVLTFAPPPSSPPAIAEVAPKALEQITEAPPEQAVDAGGNKGGVGVKPNPSKTLGPTPVPSTVASGGVEKPSPFDCVGNPPRQIEDPQSPPCVAFFEGDNGGATYQGVTADTITVVVPDTNPGDPSLVAYEGFFNRRFQFYGRHLKLIGIRGEVDNSADEATLSQQMASKVDDEYKAFATLPLREFQGTSYYRELAKRHVMSMSADSHYTEPQLQKLSPYVWQYGMALDRIESQTASWMCAKLAHKPADYTQDLNLKGKTRKFGLLIMDTVASRLDEAPLADGLKACNEKLTVVKHLSQTTTRGSVASPPYSSDPDLQAAVLAFKNAGVTSLLCLCQVPTAGSAAEYAATQNYYPEWPSASYLNWEILLVQQFNFEVSQQRANEYGLSFLPRLIRAADDPSIWALLNQDPASYNTSMDTSQIRQLSLHETYRSLLMLASGIQMAGPILTPERFEAGLQRTTFPNPDTSIRAGHVGFQAGSHAMTLDATEYWWSNTALPPYSGDPQGTWCYVVEGARRRPGQWTGQTTYQQGTCDSGR
jgi:hypothetical protein